MVEPEIVEQVLDAVKGMDFSAEFYIDDDFYVDTAIRDRLEYYNCDCFHILFEQCATWSDDPYSEFLKNPNGVRKVNLFFHDPEEYRIAGTRLATLPVNYPGGIPFDYEVCAAGISKATGLEMLCEHLGISMKQVIACGDENNDRDMIVAAGLGVAMGNASEAIKTVADVVVADCEHDGVAEAIERYLGKPVVS